MLLGAIQGWEVIRAEHLNQLWKEKYDEWLKRPKSKSQQTLSKPVQTGFRCLEVVPNPKSSIETEIKVC